MERFERDGRLRSFKERQSPEGSIDVAAICGSSGERRSDERVWLQTHVPEEAQNLPCRLELTSSAGAASDQSRSAHQDATSVVRVRDASVRQVVEKGEGARHVPRENVRLDESSEGLPVTRGLSRPVIERHLCNSGLGNEPHSVIQQCSGSSSARDSHVDGARQGPRRRSRPRLLEQRPRMLHVILGCCPENEER
jgi:hypothetical protein